MNCCVVFCLIFFVIPNLVLMCIGGFTLATALMALFMPSLMLPAYRSYFHSLYKDVLHSSNSEDPVTNCYGDWATNDDVLLIDWMEIPLAKYALYALAVVGGWLFFWSLWGFISLSRCCHKCFLVFFTIIQIVTLIGLPVVLLLAYVPFKGHVIEALTTSLNTTMEHDYYARPDKSCTSFKLAFDAVQYQGYCCSLNGYAPETDVRLNYSPVCSAGLTPGQQDDYKTFPGCVAVIRQFLDKECLLWLGIVIGALCLLALIQIITAFVIVGLWRRSRSGSSSDSLRSRTYLSTERDGFISDKDMEQYYAPGQFQVPSHHHHHNNRKF